MMKLAVAAVVAALVGAAVVVAPPVYAVVVLAVFSLGVLALVLQWLASGEPLDRDVARWTFGSYPLHLLLSLVIGTSEKWIAFFGGDADTYHGYSVELARHWAGETPSPPSLPVGKEGLFYALARLYEVIGPYRPGGLALTALCSALMVPFMADATRRLFNADAARAILPLLVLLPGFLLWTAQLLREAPTLAFLALGTCLAVRLSEQFTVGRFAMLGLSVAILFTLRSNVAYVFGAGLLVGLAIGGRHLVAGVATAAATAGLVAMIVLGGGLGEAGYQHSATADLEQVSTIRSKLAKTANSGVAPEADVSTPSGSVAYLPIGVPQLLLGPFPWQVRNFRQLLGFLEALTVWWLVPSFVRGLRQSGRRAAILLAPAVGITILLALLIGNVGTLVRERLQVLLLLMPIIALGRIREVRSAREVGAGDRTSETAEPVGAAQRGGRPS
jgi:hypothetical protein